MNPPRPQHLTLVAGEASGDLHAAHLVDEIKKIRPGMTFSGLGGPLMKSSGVAVDADPTRIAVVGFIEVLRHYREFKIFFDLVLARVKKDRPDAVVLVDYPGFNLRLARELKKLDIPVIYYISPQLWAWKENRIRVIRECIDRMLVLFAFEKDFYARHGVPATFVGHPLVDTVRAVRSRPENLSRLGLSPDRPVIGLLPGSRVKEIERMLPVMLETVVRLAQKHPGAQFLLMKAATIPAKVLDEYLGAPPVPLKIVDKDIYDGISSCDCCMVTSGTATLETALLEKPMVVVYRTSFLTWAMARALIKIPDIGLVNVVAGRRIVPECVQFAATGENVAAAIGKMLTDPSTRSEMTGALRKVRSSLGEPGASRRAAREIVDFLDRTA